MAALSHLNLQNYYQSSSRNCMSLRTTGNMRTGLRRFPKSAGMPLPSPYLLPVPTVATAQAASGPRLARMYTSMYVRIPFLQTQHMCDECHAGRTTTECEHSTPEDMSFKRSLATSHGTNSSSYHLQSLKDPKEKTKSPHRCNEL